MTTELFSYLSTILVKYTALFRQFCPEAYDLAKKVNNELPDEENYKLLTKITDLLQKIKVLPGDKIFYYYDTKGMPLDLIEDLAKEKNIALDYQGFYAQLNIARDKSKRAKKHKESYA